MSAHVSVGPVIAADIAEAREVWAYLDAGYTGDDMPMRVRLSKADARELVKRARDRGAVVGRWVDDVLTLQAGAEP